MRSIYMQIIDGHLGGFDPDVAKMAGKLVDATIELHVQVMNNFLPSAVKFHYQFNLRELSNITQGLTRMTKDYFKVPSNITSTISFLVICMSYDSCSSCLLACRSTLIANAWLLTLYILVYIYCVFIVISIIGDSE